MSDTYPYTDENRLRHPLAYMYPQLHGVSFFTAYAENRRLAVENLLLHKPEFDLPSGISSVVKEVASDSSHGILSLPEPCRQKLLNVLQEGKISAPLDIHIIKITPFNKTLDTVILLSQLLRHFPHLDENASFAGDFLQSRFEGKRLLYATYDTVTKRGENVLEQVRPYVDLALYIGASCWQRQNLRQLNALLKLCDLLCSTVSEMTGEEAWLSLCAVVLETACTQRLLYQIRRRHAIH